MSNTSLGVISRSDWLGRRVGGPVPGVRRLCCVGVGVVLLVNEAKPLSGRFFFPRRLPAHFPALAMAMYRVPVRLPDRVPPVVLAIQHQSIDPATLRSLLLAQRKFVAPPDARAGDDADAAAADADTDAAAADADDER